MVASSATTGKKIKEGWLGAESPTALLYLNLNHLSDLPFAIGRAGRHTRARHAPLAPADLGYTID